jgi:hydroxymethylglutaryl-CoA reductase
MKQKENKSISGFSKLSKEEKIQWIVSHFYNNDSSVEEDLKCFWHFNPDLQKVLDGFSENTISNFIFPFGVAPNFIINGQTYCVPMVIEESSVVAAASSAAKFWSTRGGFKAEIIGTTKIGQVHFTWKGDFKKLSTVFPLLKKQLIADTDHLTANMRKRGGGIMDIELLNMSHLEDDYYQLKASFETCDSMGANFINSVLEEFGRSLAHFLNQQSNFSEQEKEVSIIMAILSNYTPDCLVRTSVECPIDKLGKFPDGMDAQTFAQKFHKAIKIAQIDPYRATTHNKGIFNGIDAVVLATANDFRAIEANGHTYAARDGQYRSLSNCSIENGVFKLWMDIPLTVGTVGGLTKLHPLAKRSLEMLGNPSARELMGIIAVVGLAQNFAALKSLTTTGIQKGHMKMHLMNVLNHLQAKPTEIEEAKVYFECNHVSFSAVRDFLDTLRTGKNSAS